MISLPGWIMTLEHMSAPENKEKAAWQDLQVCSNRQCLSLPVRTLIVRRSKTLSSGWQGFSHRQPDDGTKSNDKGRSTAEGLVI